MISTERLSAAVDRGFVAFDMTGAPIALGPTVPSVPATLVVSPVTDAMKRMREGLVESLDRDQMWAVDHAVLSRDVLDSIGARELTPEQLWDAVVALGHTWSISPSSGP